jgi:hypothetical protein
VAEGFIKTCSEELQTSAQERAEAQERWTIFASIADTRLFSVLQCHMYELGPLDMHILHDFPFWFFEFRRSMVGRSVVHGAGHKCFYQRYALTRFKILGAWIT